MSIAKYRYQQGKISMILSLFKDWIGRQYNFSKRFRKYIFVLLNQVQLSSVHSHQTEKGFLLLMLPPFRCILRLPSSILNKMSVSKHMEAVFT